MTFPLRMGPAVPLTTLIDLLASLNDKLIASLGSDGELLLYDPSNDRDTLASVDLTEIGPPRTPIVTQLRPYAPGLLRRESFSSWKPTECVFKANFERPWLSGPAIITKATRPIQVFTSGPPDDESYPPERTVDPDEIGPGGWYIDRGHHVHGARSVRVVALVPPTTLAPPLRVPRRKA